MGRGPFSFTPFKSNEFHGGYGSIQGEDVVLQREHTFSSTMELNTHEDQSQKQQRSFDFDHVTSEEFNFESVQPPKKFSFQETKGQKDKQVLPSSLASLELLSNYGRRFNKIGTQNIRCSVETCFSPQKLSTEEIIRVAGARYLQHSTQWHHDLCIPMHPYGMSLGVLSEEENRGVELAQFLLAAAERVGCQQFERASMLLSHLLWNSSGGGGSPVERVVFHFSQALLERIKRETSGKVTLNKCVKNEEREMIEKLRLDTNMALTCHEKIPFNQVMQFAGVQAIVEHVAFQTRIHLINLDIGCGVQCTALMQALAERHERQVELLKITAIGLQGKTRLEETGKRLVSFAESLNLPFLYKIVFVRSITEIKAEQFGIEDNEAVAVYSPYMLRTMVSDFVSLEHLMRVMRKIRPTIMIVLELEAKHNSPSFVNRFIEALFFYAAFFDCIDTCMKQDYECRMRLEGILSEGIRNIVAMEDGERRVRDVKIDVWRRFFARYSMVETAFSESSLYQANLVTKKFECGNFCTVERNGKCLILGWKGATIHSISAWKFL
ncbi:DELLA protein RGL1-like [Vigna unguiculata]|uniref:DELLA protein RGL1-like n=1 Tax=Vigna unguiculata TaxID=3917 RepID=UPI001016847D|nr:DELLA protein RGL1-like [Vigna unguiculata]